MQLTNGWIRSATLVAVTLVLTSSAAMAQSITFAGAAEAGGDDLYLLFGELGVVAGGVGLRPVASVGAYGVFTSDNVSGNNAWGVTPAAGLRFVGDGGFVEGKVGWAFRKKSNTIGFFGGADDGFYSALQTEYWGDGDFNASGIVNYNFGAEYLWSRARLGKTIGSFGSSGSWGLGGELVWQGQTSDVSPGISGPKTTQIGPVLTFSTRDGGPSFSLGGGWKQNKVDLGTVTDSESTWYVKGEIFVP
jgi:hypothetical protein